MHLVCTLLILASRGIAIAENSLRSQIAKYKIAGLCSRNLAEESPEKKSQKKLMGRRKESQRFRVFKSQRFRDTESLSISPKTVANCRDIL